MGKVLGIIVITGITLLLLNRFAVASDAATLKDMHAFKFRIISCKATNEIKLGDDFGLLRKGVIKPQKRNDKLYVIRMTAELPGLRDRYQMVVKNPNIFYAAYPIGGNKAYSQAVAIKGILGWLEEPRSWALGKTNRKTDENKEEYEMAFRIPSGLKAFEIAIRQSDDSDYMLVGKAIIEH